MLNNLEKISKYIKKAAFDHFHSYFDKAEWDIAEECAKKVTHIKLNNCVIDYASARAGTEIGLGITDKNKENYMACTIDMKFENGMVKAEISLHHTPRSGDKIKEQKFSVSTRMNDTLMSLLSDALYYVDDAYGKIK
jgi:hypothetical protein